MRGMMMSHRMRWKGSLAAAMASSASRPSLAVTITTPGPISVSVSATCAWSAGMSSTTRMRLCRAPWPVAEPALGRLLDGPLISRPLFADGAVVGRHRDDHPEAAALADVAVELDA